MGNVQCTSGFSVQKVKIRNLIGAAGTAIFAMVFHSAHAETTRMHFDVTILGLKVGELRYTLQKDGTSYAASGLLYPTGLVATMTTFLYDVTVTGSRKSDQYFPSRDQKQRILEADSPNVEYLRSYFRLRREKWQD